MANLQGLKCPCCGGAIEFNSSVQKMKCPYCDTEFDMEALKAYDDDLLDNDNSDMEWNTDAIETWSEGDSDGLGVYVCDSCGGEIVSDENTAASICPFCDNPITLKGRLQGDLKPDYIIPFQLDKKAAKAKFSEHLKGKKLLPRVFREETHIDEIKGMYVPYWLFDSTVNAQMRYKATRLRHWSDSKYNYTETSHFAVIREGDLSFSHVPVDGSTKMADDLMESLEPYDFSEAVPFQSAYFAGYYADKYDVDEKASISRANERMRHSTEAQFRSTVHGFSSVMPDGGTVQLLEGKAGYAMYPVWILNTTWNGERYMFAMNGQTGKFV
ncbi:MAG: hypothetical protein PUD20_04190, partial [bacterium]|nr:hypothetical protein [bacterium]